MFGFNPFVLSAFVLTISSVFVGCDLQMAEAPVAPVSVAADGLKWISISELDPRSPNSVQQKQYMISPTSRVLLRRQDVLDRKVVVDTSHRVRMTVRLVDAADEAVARGSLQVCVVTRPWSMRATWRSAHPMPGGRWLRDGGEFDDRCFDPEPGQGTELSFDVSAWYLDYVRARGVNYGLAIVSTLPVAIRGDASSRDYPRLVFPQR